ncbi:SEC-C metal-binding domain-containing protein [Chloroflexota bacterium]
MTKVFTVRVDDNLAEYIKGEAKRRHLLLNDYLKSILTAYWNFPEIVKHEDIVKKPEGVIVMGGHKDDFKEINVNGKLIPKYLLDNANEHRNRPCPCGSGKKFKHCCGNNLT